MKIKSGVWYWMTLACTACGLALGLGMEGSAQTVGTVSDAQFIATLALGLAALLFLRLGDAAEEREEKAARRRRYGRITRSHARNPEYPEPPESRRDA